MNDKTATFLHGLVADAFKREVDADEAVWRSLPLFAAAAGLAAAVLPNVYESVVDAAPAPARIVALAFLVGSLAMFGVAGYWFWQLVKVREYVFPRSDTGLVAYAEDLKTFYVANGAEATEADEAVRDEVRDFMTAEFAAAVEINRGHNRARTRARSQVLLHVTIAFVLAFAAEVTILAMHTPLLVRPDPREGHHDGRVEQVRSGTLGAHPRGGAAHRDAAAVGACVGRGEPLAVQPARTQDREVSSAPAASGCRGEAVRPVPRRSS